MKDKHNGLNRVVVITLLFILFFSAVYLISNWLRENKYKDADKAFNEKQYKEALELFDELGFYKDSFNRAREASNYLEFYKAIDYLNKGMAKEAEEDDDETQKDTNMEKDVEKYYMEAIKIFYALGTFNKSDEYLEKATFKYARLVFDNGQYEQAAALFKSIINYVDESGESASSFYSKSMYQNIDTILAGAYDNANNEYTNRNYIEAFKEFKDLVDNYGHEDSKKKLEECRDILVRQGFGSTISAGVRYSIAITKNNGIEIWGDISDKNALFLKELKNVVSISGFSAIVAGLNEDGTVVVSADPNVDKDIEKAGLWSDIVAIKTGDQYIVGLDKNGNLHGAGANRDNQWDFENWGKIISFDTAWRRTVGVDDENVVWITGYGSERHIREIEKANRNAENEAEEEIKRKAWNNIVAVATGGGYEDERGHTVGLKEDGTVVAVGDNDNNQCDVMNWKNVIAIAAGDNHTVGLTSEGRVLYTGERNDKWIDPNGYVKDWSNIVAIDAGKDYTLALTNDGEILSFGNNKQGQRPLDSSRSGILTYEWEKIKELF